jgi:hypothetical protein
MLFGLGRREAQQAPGRGRIEERKQNAQDEDQIGRQEAVQDHGDRQGPGAAAGKRHGMIKRSNKFIRDARGTMVLAEPDGKKVIKNFLPNGL